MNFLWQYVCLRPTADNSTAIFTKLYTQVGTGPAKTD